MASNSDTIRTFYEAFKRLDAEAMGRLYADDIVFSDPVFPRLEGNRARAMWTMLCARAKEFELTFRDVQADDARGSAHWEASYVFSKTGRRVHNVIDATFEFRDGKIVRHTDSFDLWRWSRQALGPIGALLGWSPLVRGKIRSQGKAGLDAFLESKR